jgi:RNA polymerase subunit RPABC4/transcription elongation factor Spt4
MSVQIEDISNTYLMSKSETLFKILQALSFKGGSSSTSSLKIAVMLDDNVIAAALKAGEILKFIEKDEEDHALTDEGESILEVSKKEQQDIVAKNFYAIEGYRDIVFRMKMANNQMSEKDMAKAFYILEKDMRDELRKVIVDSFKDFGLYANILENNNNTANPGALLTANGNKQLDAAIASKKRKKKGGKTPAAAGGIASDLSCQSCGKSIMPDFAMCPYCGTALQRSCNNCGKELQPGWKMCPFCGTGQ